MRNFLIIWFGNEIPEYYAVSEENFDKKKFSELHSCCNDACNRGFGPESSHWATYSLWRIKAAITDEKEDKWFPKHAQSWRGMLKPYQVWPMMYNCNITAVFPMGVNFYKDPNLKFDESDPHYDE